MSSLDLPLEASRRKVISVSELNRRARHLLEANLELMWVAGELSNVVRAASGHWYFSLKDADAQVRCVMFRNKAALSGFQPENGIQVEVHALPSLYEARGEFQLGVETLRRAGLGALFEAFERLKAKLQSEGLFAAERKKVLPAFPRCIGIVTSLKAAALRDVLTTLKRRAPMIEVIIYPAAVQGAAAASELVAAIEAAGQRRECAALIICRGGGSIEDLWPFNEERVARAIANCPLPTVSGVGHETDFTIADFVADQRAPTPTAAAELLSPNRSELLAALLATRSALARTQRRNLEACAQRLDRLRRSLIAPQERLQRAAERIMTARARLTRAAALKVATCQLQTTHQRAMLRAGRPDVRRAAETIANIRIRLGRATAQRTATASGALARLHGALDLLNPERTLERGYSIVTQQGLIVRDSAGLAAGDELELRFARGRATAEVNKVVKPS